MATDDRANEGGTEGGREQKSPQSVAALRRDARVSLTVGLPVARCAYVPFFQGFGTVTTLVI